VAVHPGFIVLWLTSVCRRDNDLAMTRPLNPPGETPTIGVPAAIAPHMSVGEQRDWLRVFLRARPVSRRAARPAGWPGWHWAAD
jgi:hypothetical protein